MANKSVFPRSVANKKRFNARSVPVADTRNSSNSLAYSYDSEHALAQLAVTGTFNDTCYSKANLDLKNLKELADKVSDEFLARLTVYSRTHAKMKDMPAALAAILSIRNPYFLDRVFDRVITNGKMVRNFVQMIRSGAFGRTSLGSGPKRLLKRWFDNRSTEALFRDNIGNNPSLADVIKLVHPKPKTPDKRALYGYLLGREHSERDLPEVVRDYLAFKDGRSTKVPNVDFRKLSSLSLTSRQWADVARNGGWHQTRMNLNTYVRHGVFKIAGMDQVIADKLRDPESIRKSNMLPYQLMVAYQNVKGVPHKVTEALQDAMEVAIENIPNLPGRIIVCPDVSGSMCTPVTGYRGSATSVVRCRDAAALIASAFLRVNRNTLVLPFHNKVEQCPLNSRDSVMTNADKLRKLPSGGTNCSAPISWCNEMGEKGDLIILVSDNESWLDNKGYHRRPRGTTTMTEFIKFQNRNPGAKMVCLDLALGGTTQAPNSPDSIMNIGGFSDHVFKVICDFYVGEKVQTQAQDTWVEGINQIQI